jgi:class 3 adenylate cyclase
LIEPTIDQDLRVFELNLTVQGTAKHDMYDFLWHSLITPIYTDFFMPMLESIIPSTLAGLGSRETEMIIPNIVVFICMLVIEIIIWVLLRGIARHIKTVLRMVLACPAETLMSNPKIMRVLSGDFTVQVSDSIDQDVEFFEAIFMALPNPTLFATSELTIQNTNLAFQKLFPSTEEKRLPEFFAPPQFDGVDAALFEPSHDIKTNPDVIYHPDDETHVHLELTVGFSGNYVIVVCKQVNDLFEYEKIIKYETKMRTELLRKLLPGVLVRRMMDDSERNSGFAVVQCTSIIFLNLVKFSAWVSGVDAPRALSILNGMFARFDQILAVKSSMLRIKTFGDTYMAAGGIFSEVNQPHEHATEAVTFGLEAIKEVAKFNDEAKLNLAIRAGGHTGPRLHGDHVDDGPTFEILASTVRVAMRLEKEGVPGAVLVSRVVYELLDRNAFSMVERRARARGQRRSRLTSSEDFDCLSILCGLFPHQDATFARFMINGGQGNVYVLWILKRFPEKLASRDRSHRSSDISRPKVHLFGFEIR